MWLMADYLPGTMIGWMLSTLVPGALVVIGVADLVAPRASSSQYGIVLDDRAPPARANAAPAPRLTRSLDTWALCTPREPVETGAGVGWGRRLGRGPTPARAIEETVRANDDLSMHEIRELRQPSS